MSSETVTVKGVVHGRTIELERESGLPDGQEVKVTVEPASGETPVAPGDGLRRSAGTWADDVAGLDEYLEWNRRQRKVGRQGRQP